MTRAKTIVLCLLALSVTLPPTLLVFGCGRKTPNILILTLDTTRADRLRCYGYQHIETPAINDLARSGTLFEYAYSHIPLTLPAHTSIMSGTVPISHGVIDNGGYKVPDELITLAEIFKDRGYSTGAFISAKVLDAEFNLTQGFDTYNADDINPQSDKDESLLVADRKGDRTTDAALRWLTGNRDKPWFMWVHYYDPHMQYKPPPPFDKIYAIPYDGEIAFMDSQIKRVIEQVRADGNWDDTIIIVVGDHGESLGEHKERTHSNFIYNATQHIPLIIRFPGLKPSRVSAVVSQIDIMPTLLAYLGLEIPAQVEGESLLSLMKGEEEETERAAFLESKTALLHFGWAPLSGIVTSRYKYIKAPKPELYDLQNDPGELNNLFSPENKIALQLRARLDQMEQEYNRLKIESQEAEIDPRTKAQLEALGYVVNGSVGNPSLAAGKDPKDFADVLGYFNQLNAAIKVNHYARVLEVAEKILARDPTNPTAMFRRAWGLFGLGRFDEAIAGYHEFFKVHNETFQGWVHIGNIYVRLSQDAKIKKDDAAWREYIIKAREAYLNATKLEKVHAEASYFIGRIDLELGRIEEARQIFESEELADTDWAALGMAKYYQLNDRPGLAEAEFARIANRADDQKKPNLIFWQEYAQFLLSQNRAADALDLLEKSLKEDPALATDTGFMRALNQARAAVGSPAPAGSGSGSAPPGP